MLLSFTQVDLTYLKQLSQLNFLFSYYCRLEFSACHRLVYCRFIIIQEWLFSVNFYLGQCILNHLTGRMTYLALVLLQKVSFSFERQSRENVTPSVRNTLCGVVTERKGDESRFYMMFDTKSSIYKRTHARTVQHKSPPKGDNRDYRFTIGILDIISRV